MHWLRSVRFFFEMQSMTRERIALVDRPWEENLLHWSADGDLHGHLVPPTDGRRRSVTSDGWCPGLSTDVTVAGTAQTV